MGHISAGISRSAKPAAPSTPWTNHHERHTEPLLCCRLGSRPLDLSQQGGFPAGHRLLLCPTECSLGQTFGKTLVYPHHAIQDLQVIHLSLCLTNCGYSSEIILKFVFTLLSSRFSSIILSSSHFSSQQPHPQPVC